MKGAGHFASNHMIKYDFLHRLMGKVAICATVSEPVNAWYQSLPKGKRSEIINNVLLKHIGRPKSKGIRRSQMSRRELNARGWLD